MDQFMDQVKIVVRVLVTYRFWIAISVAALFSVIAYFLGSAPVRAKTKTETANIEKAEKDVKQFSSPGLPNDQYKPAIEEKTEVLTKDVNAAWRTLYNRQVPLLTWPETVQETFRKWGRAWPENVDPATVQLAIVDYSLTYPDYIKNLYKTCKPFDLETNEEGVVLAPPIDQLLRPAVFRLDAPPDLGKVWSTQERHWTQRTLLEVVAAVNKNAKNWDEAIIKQILTMEVGNPIAQDQRSMANGDTLEEAEPILAPGQEAAEEAEPVAAVGRGRRGDGEAMGGFSGGSVNAEGVFFINKGQYKIMPVFLAVFIDQDRVQNLLVELENSPMSVQVMDYEMARPSTRVVKPNLAEGIYNSFASYSMMGGGGGRRGEMGGRGGMGRGGMMSGGPMGGGMMSGGPMGGGGRGRMAAEMGGAMRGFGGITAQAAQATNLRGENRKKAREETQKQMENAKAGPSLFDPYYNIVEVKVYGQARFYNPPPPEPEAEPSLGEATDSAEAPASASADTTKAATPPASDASKTAPAAPAEATKAATPAPAEATKAATPAQPPK